MPGVSDERIERDADDEERSERENRRMIELLQELRVALVGVQVMFAFLLTVPFTQQFSKVTELQRTVYFVTLLCAAAASAFLIAPTAHHRLLWRRHEKHRLIVVGNTLTLIGLGLVAAAMTGVILLITDVLFKTATVVIVTAGAAGLFVSLWYLYPLTRLFAGDAGERHR
jgi:cation transport ATPase